MPNAVLSASADIAIKAKTFSAIFGYRRGKMNIMKHKGNFVLYCFKHKINVLNNFCLFKDFNPLKNLI